MIDSILWTTDTKNAELLLDVANICYLSGTIFLVSRVIKNRNSLKDFNIFGSLLNFIGMVVATFALVGLGYYMTAIIAAPTMLFWMVVTIFLIPKKS